MSIFLWGLKEIVPSLRRTHKGYTHELGVVELSYPVLASKDLAVWAYLLSRVAARMTVLCSIVFHTWVVSNLTFRFDCDNIVTWPGDSRARLLDTKT